ncbi:MAG TPA: Ldh family oxidoreductase [Burkholderiaceae bacterium]|nr:Ldh family oxidoreductase [Burkholderiaceae bacterium]
MSETRYDAGELTWFATTLFARAGLAQDRAFCVAELLVEADLLGHSTHGLALAPGYLKELANGTMATSGDPAVLNDFEATAVWDGKRLPGLWLTREAVRSAVARARRFGIGSISIRNSHHIGCLAVFLEEAARQGQLVMVASSDPAVRLVAPFGGITPQMTPDPLAVGIPTGGDPILVDISTSITTFGLALRLRDSGSRFPGQWALDAQGDPSDDPNVLGGEPKGSLLPVGGVDHGHKGYALALIIEALTQALSGFGRADAPAGWGASVWVQVFDTSRFAGRTAFERQTAWLAQACRNTAPRRGVDAVRVPGEHALAHKRRAQVEGVALFPAILAALAPWAERFDVRLPEPKAGSRERMDGRTFPSSR